MLLLGNILSLLGSTCSFISTRAKTYKKTLLIQSLDATFFTLSCLCLGGYSGVVVNAVAILRNVCCACFKPSKWLKIAFVMLTVILGILFMDKAIYGLLPIIASAYYSIVMVTTDDVKKLKIALMINNILWLIYELIILDLVGVGFKIASIISCISMIVKKQLKEDKSQ